VGVGEGAPATGNGHPGNGQRAPGNGHRATGTGQQAPGTGDGTVRALATALDLGPGPTDPRPDQGGPFLGAFPAFGCS
jgi:hypothetical protein